MTPYRLLLGDCRELLAEMPDCSVDSVVCDPPYELGFMGKGWDSTGIAYDVEVWRQCLRVLKPGGHLVAFGGTRTSHRMVCAIEDAGFDIRDSLVWIYGSGFPKSLSVSKAIDRAAGAEREVTGKANGAATSNTNSLGTFASEYDSTAPATDAARQWDGFGTALKPAHEPAILARKPLTGTVAQNVIEHGTGGLNIAGCRVAAGGRPLREHTGRSGKVYGAGLEGSRATGTTDAGRWPPNLLLTHSASCADTCADDCPVRELGEQSGERPGMSGGGKHRDDYGGGMFGGIDCEHTARNDTGTAARFFPRFRYCAKASTAEREEGCGDMAKSKGETVNTPTNGGSGGTVVERANTHPTVKPVELMQWLVRLVTPPGGLVLDPFTGSGSTGVACVREGFRFVGCELMPEHVKIAEARIAEAVAQPRQPLGSPTLKRAPKSDPLQVGLFGDTE